MSQENLELVGEVIDAVERQDGSRLIELTDPEVEWHSFLAELGEGGVMRGHDGMRRYVKDVSDAFETLRADVDDALAVGALVLLVGKVHYRGRGSGVETEYRAGWVVKFRQGRVIYLRVFREPEQAIAAVGLSA